MILLYILAPLLIGGYGLYQYLNHIKKKRKEKIIDKLIFKITPVIYDTGTKVDIIFKVQNALRDSDNIKPLISDVGTTKLARKRNLEMIAINKLSHSGAIEEINILTSQGADSVGENLAIGNTLTTSAESVLKRWVKSPGHYHTIMNKSFDWCGISVESDGKGKDYYCVLFGNENDLD